MERVKIKITTTNNHEYYLNTTLRCAPGFSIAHAFRGYISEIYQSPFLSITDKLTILTKQIVSIELM